MVVGDGECLSEMKNRVHNYELNNTVYFAGSQEAVREYYRDSDVLLICSLKEGLTLTTFEGMSMELPIVSSDVGSQSEIVNENTGALIKCMQDEILDFAKDNYDIIEIQSYVNALAALLSDKKKAAETGKNNRKLIQQSYSFKYAVKLIEDIADNCGNEKLLKARQEQALLYQKNRKTIEEFVILFTTYERKCIEANEIWRHNCYLQKLIQEQQDVINTLSTKEEQTENLLSRKERLKIRIKHICRRKCGKALKLIKKTGNYLRRMLGFV